MSYPSGLISKEEKISTFSYCNGCNLIRRSESILQEDLFKESGALEELVISDQEAWQLLEGSFNILLCEKCSNISRNTEIDFVKYKVEEDGEWDNENSSSDFCATCSFAYNEKFSVYELNIEEFLKAKKKEIEFGATPEGEKKPVIKDRKLKFTVTYNPWCCNFYHFIVVAYLLVDTEWIKFGRPKKSKTGTKRKICHEFRRLIGDLAFDPYGV